ncbi:sodium:solute symporter family transporter [Oceanobacillus chungangensis]|uniref:sodium:solute symporter family transporter n=1 Tax=Oceanobacillus chungangensis TaxID=1229152 RepID=UPI00319D9DA5
MQSYFFIAGIRSVAWTDSLQPLLMIITSTVVVLIIISRLGGVGEFFHILETDHFRVTHSSRKWALEFHNFSRDEDTLVLLYSFQFKNDVNGLLNFGEYT